MMYLASLAEETKDKIDGYRFIHTKSDLDRLCMDNLSSNKVVIRSDFARQFFTPSGLSDYIENVRSINGNIIIELDRDVDLITKNIMMDKVSQCRNIDEVIMLIGAYPKEFFDVMKYLVNKQKEEDDTILSISNQVSRLQSIIDDLHLQIEDKDYRIQAEMENKLAAQSKFHAIIARINYQYGININKNNIFKVDKNSYDKILYIKEITRVQYVDTFIYYLREILKTIYVMPTRILVIESYYASGKINQYKNLVPHHELIERDVIKGDILMLGMQPNIMKDILKNSSNISILIVLDRAGYSEQHIVGDNVEVLYTVSDLADKPEGVPNDRIISYSDKTKYIKYIKGFENLDASARISEYSSMQIVKDTIALIENRKS